jgi:polygalacturonase
MIAMPSVDRTTAETRVRAETILVTEFGAVGDGKTLNTAAIQKAVEACAAAGGGRVVVPAGVFVSGPIFLASNLEFHLSPGAVLRGSRNLADYPVLDQEGYGYHIRGWLHAALLTGYRLENVSITGTGVMDGQGSVWWDEKNAKGDVWDSTRAATRMKAARPALIHLFDCTRVTIRGVKLIDSPMYNIFPIFCRNVVIDSVTIENPWKPYNNCDGIDLMSCRDVRISNCVVDTGDDGICLKTVPGWCLIGGPNPGGKWGPDYSKPRIPCENVIIENCIVRHAHSGVAIWAEVVGGMQNVVVGNCVFDGTRTGIQIARMGFPGGYMKDCSFNNIIMRRVERGIVVSSRLDPWEKMGPGPDPETTPEISGIRFSNITGTKLMVACEMYGMEKNPVRDITFSHIRMEANLGFNLSRVSNIYMDNVEVACQNVPLVMKDAENVEVRRFNASPSSPRIPVIEVERVRESWVHGCTAAPGTGVFLGEVGTGNDVLLENNRLGNAKQARAAVQADNAWNICSHAFTGSRWIRDSGDRNIWLPLPETVGRFVRARWTPAQVDGIFSVSRVEANARPGAEVAAAGERRRIYIIESRAILERLVVFEDGELLRTVEDPKFHAYN